MTTIIEPLAPWLRDINRMFASDGNTVPAFVPPADLLVDDEGVTVHMDVPGITAGDLEIELENQTLSIRGERRFPYGQDSGRSVRRIERGFGRFERSLNVPAGLDAEQINASLTDGVLSLSIPRPESPKLRRVEIQGSGSSQTEHPEGSTN